MVIFDGKLTTHGLTRVVRRSIYEDLCHSFKERDDII